MFSDAADLVEKSDDELFLYVYAVLNEDSFLTQDGHQINPKEVNLSLELVSLSCPEKKEKQLLEVNHLIQSQMNRLNKTVSSIELKEDDSLRITTNDQLVIVMNIRNFRDQLFE